VRKGLAIVADGKEGPGEGQRNNGRKKRGRDGEEKGIALWLLGIDAPADRVLWFLAFWVPPAKILRHAAGTK